MVQLLKLLGVTDVLLINTFQAHIYIHFISRTKIKYICYKNSDEGNRQTKDHTYFISERSCCTGCDDLL